MTTTSINLLQWMKQKWKFNANGLNISDFADTGRGIRAEKALYAGRCGSV